LQELGFDDAFYAKKWVDEKTTVKEFFASIVDINKPEDYSKDLYTLLQSHLWTYGFQYSIMNSLIDVYLWWKSDPSHP
jgi:hypothetical protein